MADQPWPVERDGLVFRYATQADIELLCEFRNDPGVNYFMVRTFVEPELIRAEWLDEVGYALLATEWASNTTSPH